jgi:hypothetical protein
MFSNDQSEETLIRSSVEELLKLKPHKVDVAV